MTTVRPVFKSLMSTCSLPKTPNVAEMSWSGNEMLSWAEVKYLRRRKCQRKNSSNVYYANSLLRQALHRGRVAQVRLCVE